MEPDLPRRKGFQAIARGSALASIEQKHVQYVAMADRRAQGLLMIASILIPISLSRINQPECQIGVLVFLVCATISIVASILALMPKHYRKDKEGGDYLLHFSGISQLSEKEYLEQMAAVTEDLSSLTREISRELYHISNDILVPKFRLLRIAYISFMCGIVVSVWLVVQGYLNS